MGTDAKPLLKSTTFWFNVIFAALQVIDQGGGWAYIPQPWGATIQSAANILLRYYKTTGPISGVVKILLAALLLAAPAHASRQFVVECANYCPELEAPDRTLVIAEVIPQPWGACPIQGVRCSSIIGDGTATPHLRDGIACPCNVVDGVEPSCTARITFRGPRKKVGQCFATFPGDPEPVTIEVAPVVVALERWRPRRSR